MAEFLNWRTDPLLVDPEPLKPNTWLTANELLESNRRDSYITPTEQLLLYPIMIRKHDFISGERILQSFPYILVNKEWINKIRKKSLSLADKSHHYFMKSNYNRTIRVWQKKIIDYLENQNRLPFPLFRLVENWLDNFSKKGFIQFQSARGEDFQLPLYLSENLAYLTGVVMGDGHLAEYFVNIIDSSKEHIENLTKMLVRQFTSKTEFFKQSNANAWNVNILGKWIVRFVNFLTGQPINARKYLALREPLIFQSDDLFRRAFWRGLMDADGSYKSTLGFGSASKQLRNDFSHYLTQQDIHHRFHEYSVFGGTTFSLNIAGESRKKFAQIIGTNHPQKQQELQTLLKRKIRQFSHRPHTLLQQGEWNGQILGFNPLKISHNYFDFSNVPNLTILTLGQYIQLIRKQHHQKQKLLASYLGITPSLLSRYELDKAGIPIYLFLKILTHYNIFLHSFLLDHKRLIFKLNNSICQFDTQPNDMILSLLKGLQCKDGGYFLIIGTKNYSLTKYKELLFNYFSIAKPKKRRFNNAVLYNLIQEFCIIQNETNNFDSLIEKH